MRSARLALFPSVALLVALGALAGCSAGSPLHGRYNDFRAYFNTYYNASQKLEEGERALLNVNTPVDRGRLVDLFPTGSGTGGRTPVFDAAIDKSAELLRQRPDSKWADDALLVIGKAYFYERNVVGAEQKFRETAAAAEVSGDRRLADEARFWLGRTLASGDRYDEGVLVLRDALERPDGNPYWTARMHLALGELYARAGRWDAATVDLRDGIAGVRDADLAARGSLLLGQVEEAAGRYDAAAEAYKAAIDRRPAYEVAFAAEVNRGLVLGLDAGRTDEAVSLFRDMSRDGKNYERRAVVALAQARVFAAAGRDDDAYSRYYAVLYDPALNGQAVRGEAHFRLAEFYRDALGDYVTAAAHFDSAATVIAAPTVAPQLLSRAAIVNAGGVAATYETVARTSQRIFEVDSLLALGVLDEDAFEARIAEIESVRRAEWIQQRREADAIRTAQDFAGAQDGFGTGPQPNPQPNAQVGATDGFLGYRDPRSIQTGLLSFQRIYGDRPLVPNWRRRAAILSGNVSNTVGAGGAQQDFAPVADGLAGPPPLDLSDVPRTPAAQAALVTERAGLRYELGNTFFLALGRTDLAEGLYRQILDETPDAPVAARARYALAELESEQGRADAAAPLYRDVADLDSLGALGQAALARLEGREPIAAEAVPDTRADEAFAAARRLWDEGDPYASAVALIALGDADPDAPGAPRAFFAAALAYAEWVRSGQPRPDVARLDSVRLDSVEVGSSRPDLARPDSTRLGVAWPDSVGAGAARPDSVGSAAADSLALAAPLPPALVPVALAAIDLSRTVAPTPVPVAPPQPNVPDDALLGDDAPVQTRGSRRDRTAPRPAPSVTLADDDSLLVPTPVLPSAPTIPEAPADPLIGTPADSLAATGSLAAAPPAMTLFDYLTALAARYPGTPYADRARAMAALIAPTPSDVPVPETPASDTPTAAPVAGSPVAAASGRDFGGLRGPTPINDLSGGGVSWQVGPFATYADAQARVASIGDPSVRTAIASNQEGFMVLIGLFASPMEAAGAFEAKLQGLFAGATPASVDGLTLVGGSGAPAGGTPAPPPLPTPEAVPVSPEPDVSPEPAPPAPDGAPASPQPAVPEPALPEPATPTP